MLPPPLPTDAAYLWVLAEPGKVPVEEFNDWYDNEHVPLRMANIPEFLTGARYTAADLLKPSFAAAYNIEAVSLFSHEKYSRLRANRSPREAALIARLEALDRRTCVKIDETSILKLDAASAAPFVATIASEDITGNGRELHALPGWRRTQRHRVFDSLLVQAGKPIEEGAAPTYLTVHEFDDESYVSNDLWKRVSEGKPEVRRWKLYGAIDNTAA